MNAEDAYIAIANLAVAKAGDLNWESLIVETKIFSKMSSTVHWVVCNGQRLQGKGNAPFDLRDLESDATLFLRDNLLETTGERIWGFTFTLTKDGNFNIEYDYEKPEGFDD